MPLVTLIGRDEKPVKVEREIATSTSLLLHDLFDDQPVQEGEEAEGEPIPIPVCDQPILQLVVDYMNLRHSNPAAEILRPVHGNLFEILDEKDKNYIKPLDEDVVIQLAVTAGFLNYPGLRDLASARLAEWIKEKNVEEIRALFGLQNDFTPEELAALKKEHGIDRL